MMNIRRLFAGLCVWVLFFAAASPVFGLANRVFVSARSGNNTIGFAAQTTDPASSTTTASNTTANNNSYGWVCGSSGSTGKDVLNLEWCTGSENSFDGLFGNSTNASSVGRYSNCVFANNVSFGVARANTGTLESRVNNTITGNNGGGAQTSGTIGTFSPI